MFFVGRRGAANPNVQNLIVFIKNRLFFNVFDCFFAGAVFGRNRDVKNRLFFVGEGAINAECRYLIVFCRAPRGCKSECSKPDCFYQKQIVFLTFLIVFLQGRFSVEIGMSKTDCFLVGGPAPQNRMSKTGWFLKWSAQPPTLHRPSDIVFGGVSARPDITVIGVVRPAADERYSHDCCLPLAR